MRLRDKVAVITGAARGVGIAGVTRGSTGEPPDLRPHLTQKSRQGSNCEGAAPGARTIGVAQLRPVSLECARILGGGLYIPPSPWDRAGGCRNRRW